MATESAYGLVAALGTMRPAMYSCKEVDFDQPESSNEGVSMDVLQSSNIMLSVKKTTNL